jgi:hypothetical protein
LPGVDFTLLIEGLPKTSLYRGVLGVEYFLEGEGVCR